MPSVKIYTTPVCIYCKMAKEFFHKNNVKYEEFNVGENARARNEMVKKSGQMAVPVIDIGGQIFIGFDKKRIVKVLGIK